MCCIVFFFSFFFPFISFWLIFFSFFDFFLGCASGLSRVLTSYPVLACSIMLC